MILGRENNKISLYRGDILKSKFSNSEIDEGEELKIIGVEYFLPEKQIGLYFEGKDMGYDLNTNNFLFEYYDEWKEYEEIIN